MVYKPPDPTSMPLQNGTLPFYCIVLHCSFWKKIYKVTYVHKKTWQPPISTALCYSILTCLEPSYSSYSTPIFNGKKEVLTHTGSSSPFLVSTKKVVKKCLLIQRDPKRHHTKRRPPQEARKGAHISISNWSSSSEQKHRWQTERQLNEKIVDVFQKHINCSQIRERNCLDLDSSLPARSFSSSNSSFSSWSLERGWREGMVTPGIWGRQHGGVRAIGEFLQSSKNFLSYMMRVPAEASGIPMWGYQFMMATSTILYVSVFIIQWLWHSSLGKSVVA